MGDFETGYIFSVPGFCSPSVVDHEFYIHHNVSTAKYNFTITIPSYH